MKNLIRIGVALGLVAGVAAAQNPPAAQGAQPQPRRAMRQPGAAQQPGAQGERPMNRAQLEKQIRDRIGGALKKNLNLTDDQFTKLQATNKRFEERRRLLVEQERDARMGMRDLMIAGDTTNQGKVSAALDRMLQVQRQRFELIEAEQKELAGYMTPMQRAKYLGMQEQMFRRVEALRQQRGMGPNGPPPDGDMGPGGMGPDGMGPAGMGPGGGMGPGQPGLGQGGRQRPRFAPGAGRRIPDGPPPGDEPPMSR